MKSRIVDLSSTIGNCDFCESKNTIIVSCEKLSNNFDQLFELYVNYPDCSHSLKNSGPFLLHEHLLKYWGKLFNNTLLNSNGIKQLLNQIGRGGSYFSEALFEEPIELEQFINNANGETDDLELRWDSFSEEIKKRNRFFLSEIINTDDLQSVFERLSKTYATGTVFYRARISNDLLPANKLGKPPAEITTPGRANPVGIPYLYISESEKTTLYETRIALHEGITIGKFIATEPINLVSLKNIADYGPFEILDSRFTLSEFIAYRSYLQKLENELSKPVRKQDVNLDYLPTQFLCEFIKSLGFDAIEYKSAMNINGYNLAVFNDKKLECIETNFYTVKDLEYIWN